MLLNTIQVPLLLLGPDPTLKSNVFIDAFENILDCFQAFILINTTFR